jgi:hypothetical protein
MALKTLWLRTLEWIAKELANDYLTLNHDREHYATVERHCQFTAPARV